MNTTDTAIYVPTFYTATIADGRCVATSTVAAKWETDVQEALHAWFDSDDLPIDSKGDN